MIVDELIEALRKLSAKGHGRDECETSGGYIHGVEARPVGYGPTYSEVIIIDDGSNIDPED